MSKAKAMVITVGAQGEQIVHSLKEYTPEFVGLLATNTENSKDAVNFICKEYKIPPANLKIMYCDDNPSEIGRIIKNFYEVFKWLRDEENISESEIFVDPTGGRKWMSSGITMIASFLGLNMIYVDADFIKTQLRCPECNLLIKETTYPDKETMKVIKLGNAYEQTGFLEEEKADKLFNEHNFTAAVEIYDYLGKKLEDPRRILIKKDISEGYLNWMQFKFASAYRFLLVGLGKINQYQMLTEYKVVLQKQIELLNTLKKNDERENNKFKYSYFELLKDEDFSKAVLIFLYLLQDCLARYKQFDKAIMLLYRILEFIAQFELALQDIDTANVAEKIRQKYDEKFRIVTKKIFKSDRGIPDKIALLESWILLYCIEDDLLKNENITIFNELRGKTESRNLIWIEHGNKSVDKEEYEKFRNYVEGWLERLIADYRDKSENISFIKF